MASTRSSTPTRPSTGPLSDPIQEPTAPSGIAARTKGRPCGVQHRFPPSLPHIRRVTDQNLLRLISRDRAPHGATSQPRSRSREGTVLPVPPPSTTCNPLVPGGSKLGPQSAPGCVATRQRDPGDFAYQHLRQIFTRTEQLGAEAVPVELRKEGMRSGVGLHGHPHVHQLTKLGRGHESGSSNPPRGHEEGRRHSSGRERGRSMEVLTHATIVKGDRHLTAALHRQRFGDRASLESHLCDGVQHTLEGLEWGGETLRSTCRRLRPRKDIVIHQADPPLAAGPGRRAVSHERFR